MFVSDRDDAEWWMIKARHHLSDWKRRGGDHASLARSDERIVEQHQPEPFVTGEPCKQCGDSWPCGVFKGAITPDL